MTRPTIYASLPVLAALAFATTPTPADAATKSFLVGSYDELIIEGDIIVKLDNLKAVFFNIFRWPKG